MTLIRGHIIPLVVFFFSIPYIVLNCIKKPNSVIVRIIIFTDWESPKKWIEEKLNHRIQYNAVNTPTNNCTTLYKDHDLSTNPLITCGTCGRPGLYWYIITPTTSSLPCFKPWKCTTLCVWYLRRIVGPFRILRRGDPSHVIFNWEVPRHISLCNLNHSQMKKCMPQ